MFCRELGSSSGSGDPQSQTKSRSRRLKRRFSRIFSASKMTGSGPVSPYERMDDDLPTKKKKINKKVVEVGDDKENNNLKEVKDKKAKKKRSWKRFRQAALTTCRYIGMGVAHMSPATVHSAPDYYIDPKYWDKSFSHAHNNRHNRPPHDVGPHWTSNMMFTAGW